MAEDAVNPWAGVEVKNGLLSVVSSWMRATTRERVKAIMDDDVTAEECKIAKEALIEKIPKEEIEKIAGEFIVNRRGLDLHIADILKILSAFKDKDCLPVFLAKDTDLDKFNKVVVLDTDPQLVGPRLKSLEEKMIKITEMLTSKNDLEGRVETMLSQQRYSDAAKAGTSPNNPKQQNNRTKQNKRGPEHLDASPPSFRKKSRSDSLSVSVPHEETHPVEVFEAASASKNPWETQRPHGQGFKKGDKDKGEKEKGNQTKENTSNQNQKKKRKAASPVGQRKQTGSTWRPWS